MSALHRPVTPVSLEDWASQAFRKRMELHFQITDPVQAVREKAFTLMWQTLLEAIEMVRSASTALREGDERLERWKEDGAAVTGS